MYVLVFSFKLCVKCVQLFNLSRRMEIMLWHCCCSWCAQFKVESTTDTVALVALVALVVIDNTTSSFWSWWCSWAHWMISAWWRCCNNNNCRGSSHQSSSHQSRHRSTVWWHNLGKNWYKKKNEKTFLKNAATLRLSADKKNLQELWHAHLKTPHTKCQKC